MNKTLVRKKWKDHQRSRTLWIPFTIFLILSSMLFSFVLSFKEAYDQNWKEYIVSINGDYDFQVMADPQTAGSAERMLEKAGGEELWRSTSAYFVKPPVSLSDSLLVYAWSDFENVPYLSLEEGRYPASSKEVIAEQSWANRKNLKTGDSIPVADLSGAENSEVVISGLYRFNDAAHTEMLLTRFDEALPFQYLNLYARIPDSMSRQEIIQLFDPLQVIFSQNFQNPDQEAFRQKFMLFLLVLLAAFSLCCISYSAVLTIRQKPFYKTLYCLGTDRKQSAELKFLEMFVYPLLICAAAGVLSLIALHFLLSNSLIEHLFIPEGMEWQVDLPRTFSWFNTACVLLFALVLAFCCWICSVFSSRKKDQSFLHVRRRGKGKLHRNFISWIRLPGSWLSGAMLLAVFVIVQSTLSVCESWISTAEDYIAENDLTASIQISDLTSDELQKAISLFEETVTAPDEMTLMAQTGLSVDIASAESFDQYVAVDDATFLKLQKDDSSADLEKVLTLNPDCSGDLVLPYRYGAVEMERKPLACFPVDDYGSASDGADENRYLIAMSVYLDWLDQYYDEPTFPIYLNANILCRENGKSAGQLEEELLNLPDFPGNMEITVRNLASMRDLYANRRMILTTGLIIMGSVIAVIILVISWYRMQQEMENAKDDFAVYYSLGMDWKVLAGRLRLFYDGLYLMMFLLCSLGFVLAGWQIHPLFLVFAAVFFLIWHWMIGRLIKKQLQASFKVHGRVQE